MFACCCSSPSCQVNGCSIARQYRDTARQWADHVTVERERLRQGQAVPAAPGLTEEDVRRILREEIERLAGQMKFMR